MYECVHTVTQSPHKSREKRGLKAHNATSVNSGEQMDSSTNKLEDESAVSTQQPYEYVKQPIELQSSHQHQPTITYIEHLHRRGGGERDIALSLSDSDLCTRRACIRIVSESNRTANRTANRTVDRTG